VYFSAAGYAVLCPNYRGSTGYGDKFVTDLIGKENDIEVKDILAGIQHLIDEGIADPERVGVMGWSNGGYLTNCLISLKDSPIKFKAASSGAGSVFSTYLSTIRGFSCPSIRYVYNLPKQDTVAVVKSEDGWSTSFRRSFRTKNHEDPVERSRISPGAASRNSRPQRLVPDPHDRPPR